VRLFSSEKCTDSGTVKNKNAFKLEDWAFQYNFAYEKLTNHFKPIP
jgi:hypothetical protein